MYELGPLMTQDVEKGEVLNAAFTSVFTSKALETREESGARNTALVEENQVRQYLRKLDIAKAMGPDGLYLQVTEAAGSHHCEATVNSL